MLDAAEVKKQVPLEQIIAFYGGALDKNGKGRCLLPHNHHHGDQHPSMSVKNGYVKCWSQGCFGEKGVDQFGLIGQMENLTSFPDQIRRVQEIGGLGEQERHAQKTIEATYDYLDKAGIFQHQAVRYEPKAFRQRCPDGKGGWNWSLKGIQKVLYRLPKIQQRSWVCYVEGEKDVDCLWELDIPATTHAGGAESWDEAYVSQLTEAGVQEVRIIPDNDKPGHQMAQRVGKACDAAGIEVRMVQLPELPPPTDKHGMDVSDWLDQGHPKEMLLEALAAATPYTLSEDTPVESDGIVVRAMDTVALSPVQWVWSGRIPSQALSLIVGDPGLGKSTITMDLAAQLSNGTLAGDFWGTPFNVLIASAEDSAQTTLKPRLMAAGANLARVHTIEMRREGLLGGITLPDDIEEVAKHMEMHEAKALIIDPLFAHLSDGVNSWKDQDLRRALAPLSHMADELHAAVIAVLHLNKDEKKDILGRVGGSKASVAAARSALIVAPDYLDPEGSSRFLGQFKCNLAPLAPTLRYRLEERWINEEYTPINTSALVWEGEASDIKANDLLVKSEPVDRTKRQEAKDWLREYLKHGPKEAKDIYREGKTIGLSESTLDRAKTDLGIRSSKHSFSGAGAWAWALPPEEGHEGLQYIYPDTLRPSTEKERPFSNNLHEGPQARDIDTLREPLGALHANSDSTPLSTVGVDGEIFEDED